MAEESEESKKIIQADIFSDVIPEAQTLPLDGEVVQKDYAKLTDDKKPPSGSANPSGAGTGSAPATPSSEVTPETSTTANNPLSAPTGPKTPEEIHNEAEQAVDLMLKGYSKAHDLGRYMSKKDMHQLAADHAKGKLNLDLTFKLPVGPVTIKEIVKEYNDSIDETIVVTKEFKENVRPKLIRIAIKRGWGLSDELSVLAYLVEDVATKAGLLIGLNKSMKMILDIGYESMKKKEKGVDEKEIPKEDPIDTSGADNWHREGEVQ